MKIRRKRSKAINFCLSGGVLLAQPLVIINVSSRATLESFYNLNTMQFAQLFRSFLSKKEEKRRRKGFRKYLQAKLFPELKARNGLLILILWRKVACHANGSGF